MRIISQDGMADLPYEGAMISIDFRYGLRAIPIIEYNTEQRRIKIAAYNTMDNARKAMDLLHKVYIGEILKYTSDDEEWVPLCNGTLQWVVIPDKESQIVSSGVDNRIFQFTTDEEISRILEDEKENG